MNYIVAKILPTYCFIIICNSFYYLNSFTHYYFCSNIAHDCHLIGNIELKKKRLTFDDNECTKVIPQKIILYYNL